MNTILNFKPIQSNYKKLYRQLFCYTAMHSYTDPIAGILKKNLLKVYTKFVYQTREKMELLVEYKKKLNKKSIPDINYLKTFIII